MLQRWFFFQQKSWLKYKNLNFFYCYDEDNNYFFSREVNVDSGDFSRQAKEETPLTTKEVRRWLLIFDRSSFQQVEIFLQVSFLFVYWIRTKKLRTHHKWVTSFCFLKGFCLKSKISNLSGKRSQNLTGFDLT